MGDFKNLDMTMMFAIHDALRRELERIARITSRVDEDPRHVLSTAVGWELFKKFLTAHHTSEDLTVWPAMYKALDGRDAQAEIALLDAMEAEHAVIDPLLTDIDAALADRDTGAERLGGLVDTLHTDLRAHLDHEEREALALMDLTMSPEEWQAFSVEQKNRIGSDANRYLPGSWTTSTPPGSPPSSASSRRPCAPHTRPSGGPPTRTWTSGPSRTPQNSMPSRTPQDAEPRPPGRPVPLLGPGGAGPTSPNHLWRRSCLCRTEPKPLHREPARPRLRRTGPVR